MGLLVDSFAGGGGASTGFFLALGRHVDIAINHDPEAIRMHMANHPGTKHYCESVWNVDPREACKGQPVDVAWFSPDCKHFSKAKGAALVDRNIRGLAWIVLRWAGTVRPSVIILENVEEFVTWGPVRKGRPIKAKSGETFRRWKTQLEALGYAVESRELVAADYGAPTSRKRFYLVARCDGQPIKWPEATHAAPDTLDVASGFKRPWRTAAEIIDWSLPCPSIFASKREIKAHFGANAVRPLADNTLKRIARGIDKFTIRAARPFIMVNNNSWSYVNCTGLDEPTRTITTGRQNLLCAPSLIQYHTEQSEKVRGQQMGEPVMTVDAANRYGLAAAHLTEWYGNAQDALPLDEPMHTATAKDREALTVAHVIKFKGDNLGQQPETPLQTVTASIGEFGIIKTTITRYERGANMKYWPEVREMLNQYCGYQLREDEVVLIDVRGCWYFIADIGLRMLAPRELFNAMGFPPDYIIDVDANGNPYPKSAQVARCGNAVCPPVAAAIVRENAPESAKLEQIA